MKIMEEKPITLVETKELLVKKEAEAKTAEKEFGYEQKITLDYLRKFALLSTEDVEKLKKQLAELELKDSQIVALIDLLPETAEEIDTMFVKERVGLTKEQVEKVLSILAAAVKSKKELKKDRKEKAEKEKLEEKEKKKAAEAEVAVVVSAEPVEESASLEPDGVSSEMPAEKIEEGKEESELEEEKEETGGENGSTPD